MKRTVGEILAELRNASDMSQRELAEKLCSLGIDVSNQAVSKWENNATLPNAVQFLALCKILKVTDVLGTFTGLRGSGIFDGLDADGRAKALEYIGLLRASGMYTPAGRPDARIRRTLPVYHIAASAGTGQFLDSGEYDMVEVGSSVPADANFGVRLAGDSMQPEYMDGQIVWVRQQQGLNNGEIGIFLYQGNAYCKKLRLDGGRLRLVSLNPAYEPIEIDRHSELRVFGRVVG